VFQGGLEKNYVALRMNVRGEHRYSVVYHEYVHLLMRLNFPPLPLWLDEGLAEYFGHAVISDKSSGLGRPSSAQLEILQRRRPMPLAQLMHVDRDSPHYREEEKASIFYAQSWALTHLLMIGEKGAHAQKLWNYLDLISKSVPSDSAAERAFGDLEDLERRLNSYIRQLSFYYLKVDTPALADPKEYTFRVVPPLEMLTLRGDWFVLTQRWSEAKAMLDAALEEDPLNPAAHASMGLYHERQNQREEAVEHFEKAVESGTQSCIAHYFAGITAQNADEYGQAERNFRRAIELNPSFVPAYSGLAGVMAMDDERADEALALARKAVALEPGELNHQLMLANVLMRMKKVDEAIQLAERVEAMAQSIADRAAAERFLASARRYRDSLTEFERLQEERRMQQRQWEAQRKVYREQEEEQEKAKREFDKAEEERQQALRERAEALNSREEAERDYSEKVGAAKAGGMTTLEGMVFEINCIYPAIMELTIEVQGTLHKLHAANYFEIQYMAIGGKPEQDLQPCTDLNGRRVRVEFIATPGEVYAGEIQKVGIHSKKEPQRARRTQRKRMLWLCDLRVLGG
jgi:tetratricopeptide (TPR) repeat protein